MKKVLTLIAATLITALANAQILKGDMNGDNKLTINDVTLLVDDLNTGNNQYISGSLAGQEANPNDVVDLGLSVRWAKCNLGASKPQEFGNYYAWGETSTKSTYYPTTYFDFTSDNKAIKYGDNSPFSMLKSEDDVAFQQLGNNYRMPTKEEWLELINQCKWVYTTNYNSTGVKGYIVYKTIADKETYSLTDTHIFLPFAGFKLINTTATATGYYWAKDYDRSSTTFAYIAAFSSVSKNIQSNLKYRGCPVRPVTTKSMKEDNSKIQGIWKHTSNSTTLAFNADGTNTYFEQYKYKFFPGSHLLFFYDESGNWAKMVPASVTNDQLTISSDGDVYTREELVRMISVQAKYEVVEGSSFEISPSVYKGFNKNFDYIISGDAIAVVGRTSYSVTLKALKPGVSTIQFATVDGSGLKTNVCRVVVKPNDKDDLVDLDLGVLWAKCNVGATNEYDSGNYYAWGETTTRSSYNGTGYYNGNFSTVYEYVEELLPADDVVQLANRPGWRIPTRDEWDDLFSYCHKEYTTNYQNTGIRGLIVYKEDDSGKEYTMDDPHIFLPFSSFKRGPSLADTWGHYWTSEKSYGDSKACCTYIYRDNYNNTDMDIVYGLPIRPVRDKNCVKSYYLAGLSGTWTVDDKAYDFNEDGSNTYYPNLTLYSSEDNLYFFDKDDNLQHIWSILDNDSEEKTVAAGNGTILKLKWVDPDYE